MLRPERFEHELDPGPVQIQARKVAFDVSAVPLHWIPGHPIASHMISLLNVVLPAADRANGLPPCMRAIAAVMAKPNPWFFWLWDREAEARKKRSKMRSKTSGGMV